MFPFGGHMEKSSIRVGADIGGTFTDVVLEMDEQIFSTKVLTTHQAPELAFIEGIHKVCEKASVSPSQIDQIIHGTTLATNALIERRGAKTAFITTKGFRDVIEMRTESRFEQYDLNLTLPPPLLSRDKRYVLAERTAADGSVLIPLQRSDVIELIGRIKQAGYESVAVGFLHAYANDAHEIMVRDVINDMMPGTVISLSSEVSPQIREYERFNTTVANAYIKPLMKSYLDRLRGKFQAEGINCKVFLMHSGGGIISLKDAADFPVRLVESGPAGGAVFAANIAAKYKQDKVLSFDMGGTTAKICLIKNQTPKTSRVFEVARTYRFKKGSGMPISIPVIDMVEIGAGGGSIAHVDSMRQIRVGPESAGSEPGPACYNRGGSRPTVTDADLRLGKLDPANFAGGTMVLSEDKSSNALVQDIGQTLSMDDLTSAYGVAEVVDENMANAARVHAVENGEDLSEYTMIAFGGAAPLHASRLCEKLNIKRLLVPSGAGVGSAIGFLRAPFSFEANRSVFMRLSELEPGAVNNLIADLETEARSFVRSCDADADINAEYKVYMRYSGQGWEIPVILSPAQIASPDAETFHHLFQQEYALLFGRTIEGLDVEITVWSVNATTPKPSVKVVNLCDSQNSAKACGMRELFDPAIGGLVDADIISRSNMAEGHTVSGPAMITEAETTIVLSSSLSAVQQPDGCIDIQRKS